MSSSVSSSPSKKKTEPNFLCIICKKTISFSKEIKKPLIGDVFIQYTCASCSTTKKMISERFVMNWPDIIHLILYHLHQSDKNKIGFFRWREDICRLIEERWDDLCPTRNRALNWANSVSSVLSAHPNLFESGQIKMKSSGWWALRNVAPPRLPETGLDRKFNGNSNNNNIHANSLNTPSSSMAFSSSSSLSSSSDGKKDSSLSSLSGKLPPLLDINPTCLISANTEPTATVMSAAEEIKRKLVERLMKVDSKLLRAALTRTDESDSTVTITPASLVRPSISSLSSMGKALKARGMGTGTAMTIGNGGTIGSLTSIPNGITSGILSNNKVKIDKTKHSKPAHYVRASPHENELYESCNRVLNPDENIQRTKRKLFIRRVKRKFGISLFDVDTIMYNYLKVFDHIHPLNDQIERLTEDSMDQRKNNSEEIENSLNFLLSKEEKRIGGGRKNANTSVGGGMNGTYSSTITRSLSAPPMEFINIPCFLDPTLTLAAKIEGISNVIESYPTFIVSSYSGERLFPFIWRDWETRPQRLKLLQEIQSLNGMRMRMERDAKRKLSLESFSSLQSPFSSPISSCLLKESISKEIMNEKNDKSSLLLDQESFNLNSSPSPSSIDYMHLRKEFVNQLNSLVKQFFWSEYDVFESIECPDYSIIAVYKKLVIGFSLVNSNGYLSHLFVHPSWKGNGIAQKLLYFSIKIGSPKNKDITAHISPSNISACILYQKFGFKPEEYIIDFYEKYYKMSKKDDNDYMNDDNDYGKWIGWPELLMGPSRNAFFIRFEREKEREWIEKREK